MIILIILMILKKYTHHYQHHLKKNKKFTLETKITNEALDLFHNSDKKISLENIKKIFI